MPLRVGPLAHRLQGYEKKQGGTKIVTIRMFNTVVQSVQSSSRELGTEERGVVLLCWGALRAAACGRARCPGSLIHPDTKMQYDRIA